MGTNLVSGWAKKQTTVAKSSTKAEYRALYHTIIWLSQLLCDLSISSSSCPIIWCDNMSSISLAFNPIFHGRTKHCEVDYHFIREKVLKGDIDLHYIKTSSQVADFLTKGLPNKKISEICEKIRMTEAGVEREC